MIFKILPAEEWETAKENGTYNGSADDNRDGFIHFSASHQLHGTAKKYFSNKEGLLLVAFNPETLGDSLKWEPSRGGDLFPHLYGPLPTHLALWSRPLPLDDAGVPQIPSEATE